MRERIHSPVAMLRLHAQLLGGGRRLMSVCIGYVALCGAAIGAAFAIFSEEPARFVAYWLVNALIGVQGILVALGGCNAVHRATLRDFESRMIESHRLTPMSNISVVLGYLFGPTLQVLCIALLNVAIGVPLIAVQERSISTWLTGNLVLLNGCLMLWAVTICLGMRPSKPPNPGPIVIAISMLTAPALMIPGIGLFFGTYSIVLAAWVLSGKFTVASVGIIPTAGVAFILTLFWLSAAAAKYRRPDLPALNAVRGLVLLLFWLAASIGGIIFFHRATQTTMSWAFDTDARQFQWVTTLIISLLVAAVPISGAVDCGHLIGRGASPRGWADRVSDLATVIAAAALISAFVAAVATFGANRVVPIVWASDTASVWKQACVPTMLTFLFSLLTVRGAMSAIYPFVKSAKIVVAMLMLMIWGLPPAVEGLKVAYLQEVGRQASRSYSYVMGWSPAGTIAGAWYHFDYDLWGGLAIQGVVAGLMTLIAWRVERRIRSKT